MLFSVGRDVAKGLDTTEPCSGTWDAWDANGERGGTSGNVREGKVREVGVMAHQHCQQGILNSRGGIGSTTVGVDGGTVLPATCAEIHTSIMERIWGGVHCSWRRRGQLKSGQRRDVFHPECPGTVKHTHWKVHGEEPPDAPG